MKHGKREKQFWKSEGCKFSCATHNTSRDYRNQMFAFTTSNVFDENLHCKTNSPSADQLDIISSDEKTCRQHGLWLTVTFPFSYPLFSHSKIFPEQIKLIHKSKFGAEWHRKLPFSCCLKSWNTISMLNFEAAQLCFPRISAATLSPRRLSIIFITQTMICLVPLEDKSSLLFDGI